VHAGIRSSRARHVNLLSEECGQRLHQTLLHTAAIRLNLPSVVVCPVISQVYEISAHLCYPPYTLFIFPAAKIALFSESGVTDAQISLSDT
jgi:hypothetical protein